MHDLNDELLSKFKTLGAKVANTPKEVMSQCEVVITCLPSPNISAEVMEGKDGLLGEVKPGKIWMEMSTTDEAEVKRLDALVKAKGGFSVDCPVSGGCHRASSMKSIHCINYMFRVHKKIDTSKKYVSNS